VTPSSSSGLACRMGSATHGPRQQLH
jgi:hypothetical protein